MNEQNQENRDRIQDFNEVEALDKIRDYRDRIVEINKSFANIHYALYQVKEGRIYRKEAWERILKTDFRYLNSSENQFYINSIGDFHRLFQHLKNRYETEVLGHLKSNV